VQLTYGDDGLHPDKMEDNDRPVDFERLRLHIGQLSPCRDEDALIGDSLTKLLNKKLSEEKFQSILPSGEAFIGEIRSYFQSIVQKQNSLLRDIGDKSGYSMWYSCRFTATQLTMFLQTTLEKFLLAFVEPGEAIGATGAQSISEPGTQMTLKVRNLGGTRAYDGAQ
jgi:DNA-directed RNA polymerase III subunit RPC1